MFGGGDQRPTIESSYDRESGEYHGPSESREELHANTLEEFNRTRDAVVSRCEHDEVSSKKFDTQFRSAVSSLGLRVNRNGDIPERTIENAKNSHYTSRPLDPMNILYKASSVEGIEALESKRVFSGYDSTYSAIQILLAATEDEGRRFIGDVKIRKALDNLRKYAFKYNVLRTDIRPEVRRMLKNFDSTGRTYIQ